MNKIKEIVAFLFMIIFTIFGFFILGVGVVMVLDMQGIMKAPFKYEGGTVVYLIVGVVWTIFMLRILIKSIKTKLNLKKSSSKDD